MFEEEFVVSVEALKREGLEVSVEVLKVEGLGSSGFGAKMEVVFDSSVLAGTSVT